MGVWLNKPADKILANLKRAKILYIDEMSYKVNGITYWVRVIFNPYTGDAYFALQDSRGAKVLQELLSGWNGTIVCDGWSAYSRYRIQRCWAHLIREPRHLSEANPDNKDARNVLAWLRRIYADAKKKRPAKARQKAHAAYSARQKDDCKVSQQPAACAVHGQARKRPAGPVYIRVGSEYSIYKQCC